MSEQRKSPFATVSPYTGETLAEFPVIEGEEVDSSSKPRVTPSRRGGGGRSRIGPRCSGGRPD